MKVFSGYAIRFGVVIGFKIKNPIGIKMRMH